MLNPFGYAAAGQRDQNADVSGIMKSVRSNITANKSVVREFISKETNPQRKRDLEKIFETAEELIGHFEGHRHHEIKSSAVYKDIASRLFKLIRKQRHAGRKLFLVCLSNPLLGLDVAHYHYYTTIRGIKGAQLEMLDPFIAELEGKDIKVEYGTEPKPSIGLVNVPKSESSRSTVGNKKIKISHADLRNDISASLASIFIHHKVPIQWLETNIDTSELPNALKKKVNILINLSLVTEMTDEPIKPVVPIPVNEDGFWDSDGSIEREAVRIVERSMEMDQDNMQMDEGIVQENLQINPLNNNNDSVGMTHIQERRNCQNAQSKLSLGQANVSTASTASTPSSADPVLLPTSTPNPTRQMVSTPNRRVELPRPNESLASIGLPDEILDFEMIRTAPLETPQPKKRGPERSNTMEASVMQPLDTDSEEEIVQVQPKPAADENKPATIASSQEINELLKSIDAMNTRFDKFEKSFQK